MQKVLEDRDVKRMLHEIEVIKIDTQNNRKIGPWGKTARELTDLYMIRSVPTLIFEEEGGKELLRIPGAIEKKDLVDLLCEYILSKC